MAKGNFVSDTFEKLAELGVSTAKKTVKSVKQTFDPTKILEKDDDSSENSMKSQMEKMKAEKEKRSTPLDFDKLQKNYQDKDTQKADALRNRLFQLVKRGEEEILEKKHQEKQQKTQKELYEEQEKKRRALQQKQIEQSQSIPHGKERRSIFSKKKVAKREQTEVKPASGKQ